MSKRLVGISLILLLPLLSAGSDKKEKTYELIYKDVQLLRQQVELLKKQIEKNTEDIDSIKAQLKELLTIAKLLQSEQAGFKQEQQRIPAQSQILLDKLEAINLQLVNVSEEIITIKRASKQRPHLPKKNPKKKRKRSSSRKKLPHPPQPCCPLQRYSTWLIRITETEILN
jgi:DNA repair ATPase RecN